MRVYIDADACPVIAIAEECAKKRNVPVVLVTDPNHALYSSYSEVRVVSAGSDSVDLALINMASRGDIVITQDYGVAALALGKGAYAIHQNGLIYTDDNIDQMLMDRHLAKKARMSHKKHHIKGPPKRTKEDDIRFWMAFDALLTEALEREAGRI